MKITILTIDDTGSLVSNTTVDVTDGVSPVSNLQAYEGGLRSYVAGFAAGHFTPAIPADDNITTELPTVAPTDSTAVDVPIDTIDVADDPLDAEPPKDPAVTEAAHGEVKIEIVDDDDKEGKEDKDSEEDEEYEEHEKSEEDEDSGTSDESKETAELINIEEKDVVIKRLNGDQSVIAAITDDGENYLYVDDLEVGDGYIRFQYYDTFYKLLSSSSQITFPFTVTVDGEDYSIDFNIVNTQSERDEYGASISRASLK